MQEILAPGTGNEVDSVSTSHQASDLGNVTVKVEGDGSDTCQLDDLFGVPRARDDLVSISNEVLDQVGCDPAGATSNKYFTHHEFLPVNLFSYSLTDC